MIKVENINTYNFNNAIRGMRNALESWDKSDSGMGCNNYFCIHCDTWDCNERNRNYFIGEKDMELALKLIKSGSDHRKFLRQIFVSMDITAPMTWWWDMDTYKVATVKNSTSRMHKLGSRLLSPEDFSWNKISIHKEHILYHLNELIKKYQEAKLNNDENVKEIWLEILEDLPQSYNFLATWTGNYEVLRNVYHARKYHKQKEFPEFCRVIESLPYSELITVK